MVDILSFFENPENKCHFVNPGKNQLFSTNDIGRIQEKYGFRFCEDIGNYYARYHRGWMLLDCAEIAISSASSLSVSEDNITDLSVILHCGEGSVSIEKETDRLRGDRYLNDGWADSHIVIAENSTGHPFTQKISGTDKGKIFFLDMWEAGSHHNPADFVYPVASSFQSLIKSLDPISILT